jgi:hypothetical protein
MANQEASVAAHAMPADGGPGEHVASMPQGRRRKRRAPPELVIPATPEGFRPSPALLQTLSQPDARHARRSPTTPELIQKHLYKAQQKARERFAHVAEHAPADRKSAARRRPFCFCLRRPDRSPAAASKPQEVHFVTNPGAQVERRRPTPRPTADVATAARDAANRRSRMRELQATSTAQTSSADEFWHHGEEGIPPRPM